MLKKHLHIAVILLAGGKGLRMNTPTPKQFLPLEKKPIALHSYDLLKSLKGLSELIVVCEPINHRYFPKNTLFAMPGTERQDSVYNGFQKISTNPDIVLIHDSARPYLKKKDLEKLIHEGAPYDAATLATPVTSTIKIANSDHLVTKTLPRSTLFEIQTPQLLAYDLLKTALKKTRDANHFVTDDVSLAEFLGYPVKLVMGCPTNTKITTPNDLP